MRPPLISNIIGAIIGGMLGITAKVLKEHEPYSMFNLSFISASALSIILGIIIVVFSCRKTSDLQPILTIEDIWGGMLAGFFVGYLGQDFFGKIVSIILK